MSPFEPHPDDEAVYQKMVKDREYQETLLVKDALRLISQDRITLDDISETFLYRKLLVASWSPSSGERQWAMEKLMGLRGMKPRPGRKVPASEDDARLDELADLKPG